MAERLAEIGFVQCPHLRVVLGSSFGELFVGTVDAIDTISHVLLECFYRSCGLAGHADTEKDSP